MGTLSLLLTIRGYCYAILTHFFSMCFQRKKYIFHNWLGTLECAFYEIKLYQFVYII